MAGKKIFPEWFRSRLAPNFGLPRNDIFGWIAKSAMLRNNTHLELNAVKICKIKPDFKVLEIGFGPGVGLQAAHNIVKQGNGKVYGIDTSFYMVDNAMKRLKKGIKNKQVILFHGSASSIPLNTDSIDRVYHCNCYYFWPNMRSIMREIYRVMKPGALMVTTLNMDSLRIACEKGILNESRVDPIKYMACLENYGFEGVRIEYMSCENTGQPYQVIFAEVGIKPAHILANLSDDESDEINEDIKAINELVTDGNSTYFKPKL